MSDNELPREADVQQVSWRMNESLKACRAMVANYREMLAGVANDNEPGAASGGNGFEREASEEA